MARPGSPTHWIDSLDVPVGGLHRDWAEDWCASIRSARTRKALAGDERLSRRLGASLARQQNLPVISPSAIDPQDLVAYDVLLREPSRFLMLCGLATLAPLLARSIDGRLIRQFEQLFPVEDIRTALSCYEAGVSPSDVEIDSSRLLDIVQDAGPATVRTWAAQLPEPFRGRVSFVLPKVRQASPGTHAQERNVKHDSVRMIRRMAAKLAI